MKVLCYNIQAGCGGNHNHLTFWNYLKANPDTLEKIANKLSDLNLDIIGLVEIDAGSFRSKNQVEFLAKKLNYNCISACKYGSASNWLMFKHQHLAVLSKHKILQTKEHKFSAGFKQLALETVLQVGNQRVSVVVTHLSLGHKTRTKQIEELLNIINKIGHDVILMGDFNQENLELPSLINCCEAKTFPSWSPKIQYDYIFINKSRIAKSYVLPWLFSDHLPVYAELEI